MKPIIVINLKTYQQGNDAIKLAKKIEEVDEKIIIGVQAGNVYEIANAVKNPVYCEHVDYFEPGRNTGYTIPESIKGNKAKGTFLNHSEHKLTFSVLKKTVKRCKDIGLKTLIFAPSLKEAKKIKTLNPDHIVIEPPELVGSKKSVSKSKPELIKDIKEKLNAKFLVGAGIKTNEDLKIALKLGASGIAISSAITKSKNPKKALRDLLK